MLSAFTKTADSDAAATTPQHGSHLAGDWDDRPDINFFDLLVSVACKRPAFTPRLELRSASGGDSRHVRNVHWRSTIPVACEYCR